MLNETMVIDDSDANVDFVLCFGQMATKYKEEAELLRKQLQNAEELNANLRREIAELHRAIDKFTRTDAGMYASLIVKSEVGATVSGSGRTAWGPSATTSPSVSSHAV